jgi:hypothetical protein
VRRACGAWRSRGRCGLPLSCSASCALGRGGCRRGTQVEPAWDGGGQLGRPGRPGPAAGGCWGGAFLAAVNQPLCPGRALLGGRGGVPVRPGPPDQVAGFVAINPGPPYQRWLKRARTVETEAEIREFELPFPRGDNAEAITTTSNHSMLTDPLPADLPYVVMFDASCEELPPHCATTTTAPGWLACWQRPTRSWPGSAGAAEDVEVELLEHARLGPLAQATPSGTRGAATQFLGGQQPPRRGGACHVDDHKSRRLDPSCGCRSTLSFVYRALEACWLLTLCTDPLSFMYERPCCFDEQIFLWIVSVPQEDALLVICHPL